MSESIETYTLWSDDYTNEERVDVESERPRDVAKEWLDERWWRIGQPDEVRLFVLRKSDGKLFAFDVHVEGLQLDLYAMDVELDAEGKPLSAEELRRRADDAMAALRARKAAR